MKFNFTLPNQSTSKSSNGLPVYKYVPKGNVARAQVSTPQRKEEVQPAKQSWWNKLVGGAKEVARAQTKDNTKETLKTISNFLGLPKLAKNLTGTQRAYSRAEELSPEETKRAEQESKNLTKNQFLASMEVASYKVPYSKAAKAKNIVKAVTPGAVSGGVSSAISESQNVDTNAKKILKSGGQGALFGGAMGAAGYAVSKLKTPPIDNSKIVKKMVTAEDMGFIKKTSKPIPENIKYNKQLEANVGKGIAEPMTVSTAKKVKKTQFLYEQPKEQKLLTAGKGTLPITKESKIDLNKYIMKSQKIKQKEFGGGLVKKTEDVIEVAPQRKIPLLPGKVAEKRPEYQFVVKTPKVKGVEFMPAKEAGVTTKLRRVLTSGEAELKAQGKSGKEFAEVILKQRKHADITRGQYEVKLMDAMKGLSKQERILAGEIVEGINKTSNPKILNASNKLKNLLDELGSKAEQSKLEIQLPNGKSVPFKMRENYFPRIYDIGELTKSKNRMKFLQHLVDTGQAQNIADADRIFESYIKGNTIRRAGNLEHARTVDLPGYEKDPMEAVAQYINSSTRRISEAEHFGRADEIAKNFIDKVRQEGGDAKYAQEVFDLMVGAKKYNNVGVDYATKFNYITKLDLGAVTNATQSVNTATKAGVMNTLDGILKAYFTPYKAGKFARSVGVIEDPITSGKAEGLSMGKIMETVLKPFSFVEKKNRTIAAIAGKNYAEQMAKRLLKNPNNKLAIRQLKSMGIEPEKIIAQRGITMDDIFGGAKAVTDKTQFKVDAIDIPPGWKTNVGRLLTQFKSFSFKQTIFIRDEVIKEARYGNFMPLMRIVALGVPASFLAQTARNKLTGRSPKSEESSIDIRKLDTYLKAIGSLPVDLYTQGEFLASTYKNKYASPLKKVGRTTGSVAGPTAGEAFNMVNALEQVGIVKKQNEDLPKGKAPGDPYLEMKRTGAGYIPFAGEYIKNKKFAYPKDNVSDFTRVIRAVETGNQDEINKALEKYSPKSRKTTLKQAQKVVEEQMKR